MRRLSPFFFLLFCIHSFAQSTGSWKQHKCAVTLTYDDAIDPHLDQAIPLLDSLGLKATFFLTCSSPAFTKRIAEWKQVAVTGHELGNHTLFHPCEGGKPGRDWVIPEYDLRNYSIRRMQDEMRMTNAVLFSVDGKQQRTFAYPCGDQRLQDSLYLDPHDFVAARATGEQLISINEKNLYSLGCFGVNGHTGEQLINEVKKAMASGKAIVFLFHGVGGGHPINVSLEAHRQLLQFLKEQEKEICTTTFLELAEWIRGKQ
ncbi:polysaccharide deacetylase family protein [Pseudobacter ginsenosidimutans]|nr:polysaccharide deacetylase family protein [Pseudobacter ginsenosidimutans]